MKDLFSSFCNKFDKLVNKHAPMKTISNRKEKQLSKPWITQGLRTSIKIETNYMDVVMSLSTKLIETKFVAYHV